MVGSLGAQSRELLSKELGARFGAEIGPVFQALCSLHFAPCSQAPCSSSGHADDDVVALALAEEQVLPEEQVSGRHHPLHLADLDVV